MACAIYFLHYCSWGVPSSAFFRRGKPALGNARSPKSLVFYVAPDWGRANGIAKGKGILVLKHGNSGKFLTQAQCK